MKQKIPFSTWVSTVCLFILFLMALLKDWLSPFDPLGIDFMPLDAPGLENIFGTDSPGRDVFGRFVAGARISFIVGMSSVAFAAALGICLGLMAANFKPLQAIFMRFIDAIWAFPIVLLALALALAASLEPGVGTVIVGTAIVLESRLSFLGVDIQPPTPSWGVMLRSGCKWLEQAPLVALLPGLGIYLTVVSFSVLGDWMRVALDPKQLTRRV